MDHEDPADRELMELLERKLGRRKAPASLHRELRERYGAEAGAAAAAPPPRRRRLPGLLRTAAAVAAGAALVGVPLAAWHGGAVGSSGGGVMWSEAVNDHLRVLYSQHPLEVESGGIHQVKPWFEGKIDFAPVTAFAGDDEFPLQGGLVSYFVDRKAATFIFKRRLHVVTLSVFPAAGLPWPLFCTQAVGAARACAETSRGFHTLLWRQGDLGYALVSDLNEAELEALGAKIAGP